MGLLASTRSNGISFKYCAILSVPGTTIFLRRTYFEGSLKSSPNLVFLHQLLNTKPT